MELLRDGKSRFRVDGDLTFETVPELWHQAPARFAGITGDTLTVDLTAVRRADSAGLALLVAWVRWGRQRGVRVRFTRPPKSLQALAAAAGLQSLLGFGEAPGARRRSHGEPVVT